MVNKPVTYLVEGYVVSVKFKRGNRSLYV